MNSTIIEALNIDKPQEREWIKCIIEGELVVYSDRVGFFTILSSVLW